MFLAVTLLSYLDNQDPAHVVIFCIRLNVRLGAQLGDTCLRENVDSAVNLCYEGPRVNIKANVQNVTTLLLVLSPRN